MREVMGRSAIYGVAGTLLAILVLTALLSGEPTFALPIVLLAVIVLGYLLFNDMLARRKLRRHDGDARAANADSEDPVPTAHVIEDDATALGDTPEAHDEINPHDLPPDAPGRRAAEEMAGGQDGTTEGHDRPDQAGGRVSRGARSGS
jgi:hypothetical protein